MEVGGQAVLVKLGVPGSADQRWRISVFMAFLMGNMMTKHVFLGSSIFRNKTSFGMIF
jgi:hypothetical protein